MPPRSLLMPEVVSPTGCGVVPLYGLYRDYVSDVFCRLAGQHACAIYVDEQLVLEQGNFDTVIASDLIEHLHTPQALFDSAARALRPGGKLIIGVPFFYWLHEIPHDYHRYTRFALERMTMKAGLSTIELSSYGGVTDVLSDLATKAVSSRLDCQFDLLADYADAGIAACQEIGGCDSREHADRLSLVAEKVSAPPSSGGG